VDINKMEWPLSKEELEYLYWEKKLSQQKIANKTNVTWKKVRYWMEKFNIKTRKRAPSLSQKDYEKKVYQNHGNSIKVIGNYKGYREKVKLKCTKHQKKFEIIAGQISLNKYSCPDCAKENTRKKIRKRNEKKLKNKLEKKYNGRIVVVGEYVHSQTKITIKCLEHNLEFKSTPNNLLNKKSEALCPKCLTKRIRKTHGKTTKEFKKEIQNTTGDEYEVLGEYQTSMIKIKMKHTFCGHKYKVRPASFLRGARCPKCARSNYSKGEKTIEKILNKKNIEYNWQHSFRKCKNEKKLPFDFKIKNKPIVIEYNGRQHYEAIEYYGGKKQLKTQQKRDKIKKDYCKENGIKLIEIPYWEKDNIEEILKEELMLD